MSAHTQKGRIVAQSVRDHFRAVAAVIGEVAFGHDDAQRRGIDELAGKGVGIDVARTGNSTK